MVPGVKTRLLTRRSRVRIPPRPLILLESNFQFSSRQSEQKKRRALIAAIRAVAVREKREEETKGEGWKGLDSAINLRGAIWQYLCNIYSCYWKSWNIDLRWLKKKSFCTRGSCLPPAFSVYPDGTIQRTLCTRRAIGPYQPTVEKLISAYSCKAKDNHRPWGSGFESQPST